MRGDILARIIDFLPDATFVIDTAGRVIVWNRAMEELTGVPADDILGKREYEYAIPLYGERRPILIDLALRGPDEETEKRYEYVHRAGECLVAQTRGARPRGENAILWGRARPLYDGEGRLIGATESIRDVTAWRTVEQALEENRRKLAEAMDLAHLAHWELDVARGSFTFNDRFYTLYGTTAEEEGGYEMLAERYFRVFVHPDDRQVITGELEKAVASSDADFVSQLEHRIIRRDGGSQTDRRPNPHPLR